MSKVLQQLLLVLGCGSDMLLGRLRGGAGLHFNECKGTGGQECRFLAGGMTKSESRLAESFRRCNDDATAALLLASQACNPSGGAKVFTYPARRQLAATVTMARDYH